jgi:hypothetical protein
MMPKELGGVVSPELLVYGQSFYLWAPCQYLLTEDFRYNESPSGGCVYPSAECFPAHYFGLVRSRGKGGTHDPEGGLKVRKVDRSFEYMFLEDAPKTPETLLPILSQENHRQRLKALVIYFQYFPNSANFGVAPRVNSKLYFYYLDWCSYASKRKVSSSHVEQRAQSDEDCGNPPFCSCSRPLRVEIPDLAP